MLVSSQYKHFIELIFDRGKEETFRGKYTGALSTSIHFFDNTAHDYIRGISEDLGMEYVDYFSAEMQDLFNREKRKALCAWFNRIVEAGGNNVPMPKLFAPLNFNKKRLTFHQDPEPVVTDRKITVISDNTYNNESAAGMRVYVERLLPNASSINLTSIKMGPCRGCCKCGLDNICAYNDSTDEFIPAYNEKVLPADVLVFVLDMKDRYFGYKFQCYLERNFVRTHQPVLEGKKILLIVSGPLSQNHAALLTIQSYFDVMKTTLVSVVSDESGSAEAIQKSIEEGIHRSILWSKKEVRKPQTFLGIGGMKIFRDDIFERLNMVFQADHKYYKKHGIYDFPYKKIGMRIACFFGRIVTKIPFVRKKFRNMMVKGMTMPYQRIMKKAHLETDLK